LPPLVIFKRKTIPKENFSDRIIVEANPKGWINESTMKIWLNKVWRRRPRSFMNPPSILILDSCRAHLTENVKREINKYSKMAVIPAGLTKKLQPLDISVNRSFKSKLRKKWEDWMINSTKFPTTTDKIKRMSYSEI
jgi:DDE superfamily endonuclease